MGLIHHEHAAGHRVRVHAHAFGDQPHDHILRAVCLRPECAGAETHNIHHAELVVDYWRLTAALGRVLEHDSPEFWEVVAALDDAFPEFDWKNAMTDGGS